MADPDDQRRYRDNLQDEVDGAAVYTALADVEEDPNLAKIYRRLAAVEGAHAAFWRSRLDRAAPFGPSLRARGLSWLARRFGPGLILPTLAASEARGSSHYDAQPDAVAGGLPADERSHARIISAAASTHTGLAGPSLARLEGRHRGGGNTLRAAVLGANDGLVSNLSLVMGIAGAAAAERTILLTGLAGLVAGACSMAMGEWLSVTSSRELYQRQIATEAAELEQSPEEEKEELALIYQAKGLGEAEAHSLADRLLGQGGSVALDTLVREELGIDPKTLGGSAYEAAATSFVLFALGAIFPVMPFFFLAGDTAILASLALSGLALALIGSGTSLFTGRGLIFSALRQVSIGYAAALITYAIGRFAGIALA